MQSIASVLKYEIRRLARKEAKALVAPLNKDKVALKRRARELAKRVAQLEKEVALVAADVRRQKTLTGVPAAAKEGRIRITAKGMKSLRRKLRVTQSEFAKLLGVTAQSVYQWESRGKGGIRLRSTTKAALLEVRGMGSREARLRLEKTRTAKKS